MEKAARDELMRRLFGILSDHPSGVGKDSAEDALRTLFADYDALKEKHRLCGTKIAAQKGIVQGLRTKIAAETDRCVAAMRSAAIEAAEHLESMRGIHHSACRCALQEAAMREGE